MPNDLPDQIPRHGFTQRMLRFYWQRPVAPHTGFALGDWLHTVSAPDLRRLFALALTAGAAGLREPAQDPVMLAVAAYVLERAPRAANVDLRLCEQLLQRMLLLLRAFILRTQRDAFIEQRAFIDPARPLALRLTARGKHRFHSLPEAMALLH